MSTESQVVWTVVLLTSFAVIVHPSLGQVMNLTSKTEEAPAPAPAPVPQDFRQIGLREHNKLRAKHGSPPLILHDGLTKMAAACATYYANRDKQDHTCPYLQGAGENIAFSRTRPVEDKIREWYNEIGVYDYRYPGLYRQTSHFTQLVWRNSQHLGIGRATNPANQRVYYVALYWPAGNVVGSFRDNVPIQSQ